MPIPVTLLTGFLGSGKTTLLNALLRHPDMAKTAVVMNEFGEIALDHDLIEQATETMVLMQSGCLCCTVRGDLSNTLADLRERRSLGEVDFERVVIETTGLADPGPIVQTLVMDPELADEFLLDGVLTTADCATGPASLDAQFEAVQQVAMADRIVLTKTDMVSPEARAAFEARLGKLNPGAPRLVAVQGEIAPAALFDLSPKPASSRQEALDWVGKGTPAPLALPLGNLSGIGAKGSEFGANPFAPTHGLFAPQTAAPKTGKATHHDNRISSQSATLAAPVQPVVFDLWLDTLISMTGDNLLRLKAVVHIEGLDHPFVLHGVQQIIHPPVALPDWPKGDTVSKIVLIGRDLAPGLLENSLAMLRTPMETRTHRL